MQIQLDVKALNKLIDLCGGDEFVLELRKGVVENVMKMRVKALADHVVTKAMESQIAAEVARQVGTYTNSWKGSETKIAPELLAKITEHAAFEAGKVSADVQTKIKEAVQAKLNFIMSTIEASVEAAVTRAVAAQVDTLVNQRLKAMRETLSKQLG